MKSENPAAPHRATLSGPPCLGGTCNTRRAISAANCPTETSMSRRAVQLLGNALLTRRNFGRCLAARLFKHRRPLIQQLPSRRFLLGIHLSAGAFQRFLILLHFFRGKSE